MTVHITLRTGLSPEMWPLNPVPGVSSIQPFEETCLRRKNLRLCQQKQASKKPHSCSPPSRSRLFPSHRLVASSPSASVSSVSTITTTGNQGPTNNELIPERYHSLRDAKTYAELRRILDRNGRYLSRAANIGGSQGQCNQWQLRQPRGSSNRTLVTRDDYDDGTKSTCSSSYWSEHNEQRGGGSGTAALLSAKQQQQQQRVRKRERQLSREQCDDTALLRYVRQQQCVTQDSSSVAGIQWHIDYLDACTQRAEEVKRRFVEKKFYNANQQGNKPRISGSVFKVQESETEVFDPEELGSFQFRKPIIRADIMDSHPSKLCHEKAEKLQNLIDNL